MLLSRRGLLQGAAAIAGQALASAVARLAADPARRAAFGAAAREAVAGRTWAAVGDELIEHYVAVHSGGLAVRPAEVPA